MTEWAPQTKPWQLAQTYLEAEHLVEPASCTSLRMHLGTEEEAAAELALPLASISSLLPAAREDPHVNVAAESEMLSSLVVVVVVASAVSATALAMVSKCLSPELLEPPGPTA